MFARLLIMTKQMQHAAIAGVLQKRTVVRLTDEEWSELLSDPQFSRIHDGKTYTVMNDIVIRCKTPPSSSE